MLLRSVKAMTNHLAWENQRNNWSLWFLFSVSISRQRVLIVLIVSAIAKHNSYYLADIKTSRTILDFQNYFFITDTTA